MCSSSIPTRIFTVTGRSEEHTSELQSLAVISYAVFCLKKKNAAAAVIAVTLVFVSACADTKAKEREAASPKVNSFFFNDTATTEIYTTANTLSLHDALPI